MAATYVYVSNAEDGDIGTYRMRDSGELEPGARVKAGKAVMPMAVSPDGRFLYAASRAKPFTAFAYSIDQAAGDLALLGTAPLAESYPFISLDQAGRFLLGASYGANLVGVSAIGADGRVAPSTSQIVPVGRNAHSIGVDRSNRFVFVPTLGSDQIFQFTFDAQSGELASNTPAVALMKAGTGPRHFIVSPDNKFLYALGELQGTITTFALDGKTGLLTELGWSSALAPYSTLVPGAPRGVPGAPLRTMDNDIWCADIHMTPDGRFLYASERTSSTISGHAVDGSTGKLTYISTAATEKQPRGFAIDAKGRFLVASGEKSETISVYAIDAARGTLKLVGKYPAGKGANWVEVVTF